MTRLVLGRDKRGIPTMPLGYAYVFAVRGVGSAGSGWAKADREAMATAMRAERAERDMSQRGAECRRSRTKRGKKKVVR